MRRYYGTLTASINPITVTLADNETAEFHVIQGGTGSYTITWAGVTTWLTPTGAAPVLKTTVGASDVFRFFRISGVTYGLHYGETGPAGGTGATGPTGITWRGAYNSANTYSVNDVVSYNGSSYIAVAASSSTNAQQPDTATAYWEVLATGGGASSGSADTVDPFTRADNANISTNGVFAYTVDAGTLAIASNVCVVSTTTHAYARATGAVPASADQHAQVTISTYTPNAADNLQIGVTCRNVSSTATRYEAEVKCTSSGTYTLRLHSLVAGVDTILGTYVLASVPVAGDTIKLTCVGTAITVYYNGVSRIAVTDSAVDGSSVGGKQCGFHMLEGTASVQAAISEFRFGSS